MCKPFGELNVHELYQLLQLRINVFVVEQDCPYPDADGKDLHCDHLCGYIGQQLAAYARLVPEGISYKGYVSVGRVVVDASCRGLQAGRALMEQALQLLKEKYPGMPVKISAQLYLKVFYESFGFMVAGAEYLEDNIPHIAMILEG